MEYIDRLEAEVHNLWTKNVQELRLAAGAHERVMAYWSSRYKELNGQKGTELECLDALDYLHFHSDLREACHEIVAIKEYNTGKTSWLKWFGFAA